MKLLQMLACGGGGAELRVVASTPAVEAVQIGSAGRTSHRLSTCCAMPSTGEPRHGWTERWRCRVVWARAGRAHGKSRRPRRPGADPAARC